MKCSQFVIAMEDFLARHPGVPPDGVPAQLAGHAAGCARCQAGWRTAVRSRRLLLELRGTTAAAVPADPYFLTRLRVGIRLQQERRAARGLGSLHVAWRDLVIAAVLFVSTLGSFVYNFQRTERPNVDEAMVLDVPHLNPQHPADSHVHPKAADVMLSLMNP